MKKIYKVPPLKWREKMRAKKEHVELAVVLASLFTLELVIYYIAKHI